MVELMLNYAAKFAATTALRSRKQLPQPQYQHRSTSSSLSSQFKGGHQTKAEIVSISSSDDKYSPQWQRALQIFEMARAVDKQANRRNETETDTASNSNSKDEGGNGNDSYASSMPLGLKIQSVPRASAHQDEEKATAQLLATVMKVCIQAGQHATALEVFEQYPLLACSQEDHVTVDKGDMSKDRDTSGTIAAYHQAVIAHKDLGQWRQAVELFCTMQDCGFDIPEDTYTAVMHASAGHFEEAMSIRNGDWYRDYRHRKPWFA